MEGHPEIKERGQGALLQGGRVSQPEMYRLGQGTAMVGGGVLLGACRGWVLWAVGRQALAILG